MEEQIQIMRQKILQQRRAMGGVNASKDNHFMIQKQIRILENRLDKSLIKFNEAISHNKSLRDHIDDLRRERVVFENVYRKMERELQERKRQMAEIIEVSNQAYEQRDTYQMEVAAIEQANRKEQEEFEEQMLTLGRMLDTELQMPNPGGTATASAMGNRAKSMSRLGTKDGGGSMASRGGGNLAHSMSRDDVSRDLGDSALFKSSNNKSMTGVGDLGGVDIDFHERAQNFEEAFNKIKSATGITRKTTVDLGRVIIRPGGRFWKTDALLNGEREMGAVCVPASFFNCYFAGTRNCFMSTALIYNGAGVFDVSRRILP